MLKDIKVYDEISTCDICDTCKLVKRFDSVVQFNNECEEPYGETHYKYINLCKSCIKLINKLSLQKNKV